MTADSGSAAGKPKPQAPISPNDVLRFLLELFALFSLGYWGYLAWPFPLPGVFFMIGAPLFAAVIWGLFRSPKAVFPQDVVGRTLVEVFVMGAAVAAWFMLGFPIVGIVFGVVAAVSGFLSGRKETGREQAAREDTAHGKQERPPT
ncbi:MAG: 4-amino-4-deoxy-L-arabinose transferase [Microbacteriaceae bacterium]|nr:4-amino-4-deoxy-L-arabinose transferase [Microbacteriaceae bacterium]